MELCSSYIIRKRRISCWSYVIFHLIYITEILCPEPYDVDYAKSIIHGNRLWENTTYICHANHRINGTSTNTSNATCQSDENLNGIWVNVPVCEGKLQTAVT